VSVSFFLLTGQQIVATRARFWRLRLPTSG